MYYLLVGKTKTGKPKFYTSKKSNGTPVDKIPDGYELHESPSDALVHVRKVRPTRLLPQEQEQVADAVRSLAGQEQFILDVEGDSLVVYLPDTNADMATSLIGGIIGQPVASLNSLKDWAQKHSHYTPLMRFSLIDPDRRIFTAERWCFLGSIDDWFLLGRCDTLTNLLKSYVPHLGQESFFELM